MRKIKLVFEGGLGNQLFQLAYGMYLQGKYGCKVSYDVSKFKTEAIEYREFELDSFDIPQDWQREKVRKGRVKRFGYRYLLYLPITYLYIRYRKSLKNGDSKRNIDNLYQSFINFIGIHRCHFANYTNPSFSLLNSMLIYGQWIWKEMVKSQENYLKDEIKVVTPLSDSNAHFLEQIKSTNSVGVHIRRGDYVTLGLIACNIKYYEACIKRMSEIENNAVFFIFSDDIPWVKDSLKVEAPLVFIDNNNPSPEDMRLLYSCNHFIMSNSTFSWWGAFLGKCPTKKVMCPRYWNIKNMKKESSLIFDEWIKIDNSQYL